MIVDLGVGVALFDRQFALFFELMRSALNLSGCQRVFV